jgi:hypothetical protein
MDGWLALLSRHWKKMLLVTLLSIASILLATFPLSNPSTALHQAAVVASTASNPSSVNGNASPAEDSSVIAQPQGTGSYCCHRRGQCQPGRQGVVGSTCYCPSSEGPVEGLVC